MRIDRLRRAQRQTFRRTASLEEFRQRRFKHREACGFEFALEAIAGFVHDDNIADINGITSKIHRVGLFDDDAFFDRYAHLNNAVGVEIKRRRVVHQVTTLQRTEAGIEVVEALVHQLKRQHFNIQPFRQVWMRIEFRTETVTRPQPATFTIEQSIARPFKG